eukprot:5521234-Pleurochrysis_carterae.AAC.1
MLSISGGNCLSRSAQAFKSCDACINWKLRTSPWLMKMAGMSNGPSLNPLRFKCAYRSFEGSGCYAKCFAQNWDGYGNVVQRDQLWNVSADVTIVQRRLQSRGTPSPEGGRAAVQVAARVGAWDKGPRYYSSTQ